MFGGMMGGPGGGGDLQLIANPAVQKDLNITAKQKTQLRSVEEATKSGAREIFAAARENGIDPQAIGEQMTALRQDQEARIGRLLDKKQKTRLSQIKLQREGLTAVTRSEVSSKLKITNPQTKQIKKILESMNKEIGSAMPAPPQGFGPPGGPPGGADGFFDVPKAGPPGGDNNGNGNGGAPARKKGGNRPPANKTDAGNDPNAPGGQGGPGAGGPGGFGGPGAPNMEDFREKMTKAFETMGKARESAVKQIEDILTDDQKSAWTKLIGEPFDLSTIQPGPGGPGGPGGPREKGADKKAKKDAGGDANQ